MKILIKQGILIPFLFFCSVLVSAWLVPKYDWIGQHVSELTIAPEAYAKLDIEFLDAERSDYFIAQRIVNIGAVSVGVSSLLMAIGLLAVYKRENFLSAILIAVFGVSMIFNGCFPMGTPMHGLYGIGLSFCLVPILACYEMKGRLSSKWFFYCFAMLWICDRDLLLDDGHWIRSRRISRTDSEVLCHFYFRLVGLCELGTGLDV